jgi:hypothetical protein
VVFALAGQPFQTRVAAPPPQVEVCWAQAPTCLFTFGISQFGGPDVLRRLRLVDLVPPYL